VGVGMERSLSLAISEASTLRQLMSDNVFMKYLENVKEELKDEKAKYNKFLDVLKDFKEQHIDIFGIISYVKYLFKGHQDLIIDFNAFLPKCYKITPQDCHNFDNVLGFVNKVKARFQMDGHAYKGFL
jgi:paired amphipathic helix protein Sin3a